MGIESNGKYGCVFDVIDYWEAVYVMSSWKRGFLEIIAEILESLMANPLKKHGEFCTSGYKPLYAKQHSCSNT